MAKPMKSSFVLMVLAVGAYLPMTYRSSAISVELAKKCRAMAIKAQPNAAIVGKAKGAEKD